MASAQDDSFVRYVKLFNVVAGVLLVVGTLVLVGALIIKSTGDNEPDRAASKTVTAEGPDVPIGLGAPAGSEIVGVQASGGHALFSTRVAGGKTRYFLLDLQTGSAREVVAESR